MDTHCKALTCAILSFLLYNFSEVRLQGFYQLFYLSPSLLYYLGQSFGWGKWVGALLEQKEASKGERFKYEEEGHTIIALPERKIFGIKIPAINFSYWDGIHHLANLIINFEKEGKYLDYCRVALSIRGIYWWLPVLVPFVVLGAVSNLYLTLVYLILLGITFPLSEEIALRYKLKKSGKEPKYHKYKKKMHTYTEIAWAYAEYIYGFFCGLLIALILL